MNGSSSKNGEKISGAAAPEQSAPKQNGKTIERRKEAPSTPAWAYFSLVLMAAVTYFTIPTPFQPHGEPTLNHVFYYGWLTALSTGLGVLPFLFIPDVATYWVGICNAIAAGMMIAASYSLFMEGCTYDDPHDKSEFSTELRTAAGAVLGLMFILGTKKFLDQYEDLKVGVLGGADARKALLIFFVMTLHSFSEGVGVGVSFGGVHGSKLGTFISASLAVHNIPEGLAIAVVLLPRGVSTIAAAVWAVATSLPQPLMAVPAYLFVHHFIPFLPVGLGFAGGAMAWVAIFELLMEALEDTNLLTTGAIAGCSLLSMVYIQSLIDDEARS
mmetsp:Transcript_20888/g.26984  ORF Transcript_20888/g.26984 Transcript_20888/m.26984 type:complete len:328 (+) Transcript_20888:281-1264(+)|eukprot:CAMPEP_0198143516 /NCGR_PEP_ID=MMETSP1443-20131203/8159_1 /TAXON_ID=186043 /ORGANISM="Entomoneis sp., Strain CCMP2396" /LENGTH=327 /DNA_ID=CAMNT_0043806767 /DNA_START=205 /DNA_END=1188 /DNA_ORIENTATION=+